MRHVLAIAATACVLLAASSAQAGWAALADNGHGHWGYAVGKGSGAEASSIARNACQAPDCKVTAVKQAACIAFVTSPSSKGYGMGGSVGVAVSNAKSFCEVNGAVCQVVKAACE